MLHGPPAMGPVRGLIPRLKPADPLPLLQTVPPEFAGERLDHLLPIWYPDLSRARLQEWIRSGCVTVGDAPAVRPSQTLLAGDVVRVEPPVKPEVQRVASVPLEVVFDDPHVLAIHKPPGMLVHPREGRGRGDSVSELAEEQFGPLPPVHGEERPGVVHRLDMDTSGVLLLARTELAGASLPEQFRARTVKKVYLAIVQGDPRFDSEWIETPIERHPRSLERMRIAEPGTGRESETYYEVRERFGHSTLLECQPRTGRTHQIRVHLESIGLPILGDRLYTGGRARRPSRKDLPTPARQALHALSLEFDHPVSGERTRAEAPLAKDLAELLDALRAG